MFPIMYLLCVIAALLVKISINISMFVIFMTKGFFIIIFCHWEIDEPI